MAKTRKKNNKRNKRRWQLRIFKLFLSLIVIALPCVWLFGTENTESEPMITAKAFADHLVHARFDEARMLATPQSAEEIDFFAEWVGEQQQELQNGVARFKVTHAQILMPADTTNVIHGAVLVPDEGGGEREVLRLQLNLLYTIEGWRVDYHADFN